MRFNPSQRFVGCLLSVGAEGQNEDRDRGQSPTLSWEGGISYQGQAARLRELHLQDPRGNLKRIQLMPIQRGFWCRC